MERTFPSTGMSQAAGRKVVTGKHRTSVEVEDTDRGKRDGTAEATAEVNKKGGPEKKAKKRAPSSKTKESKVGEALLPLLYDIALPDKEQPAGKLEFLRDQRGERKCRLPPINGVLKVESRRKKRDLQEEKRRKTEEAESATQFQTIGRMGRNGV